MSATGIVSQQIGEYEYRVASDSGIDAEFTGISISKEPLSKGMRVRIINVVSGRTGLPEYGFCREDAGLRGVVGIPEGQKSGFIAESPGNFMAAYVAFHAGKVVQLYDIAEVIAIVSGNLSVVMLTGDVPFAKVILACSGVWHGSFVPGDIVLVRRGDFRSLVVGWWMPVLGPVTITLTMVDTDGNNLTYELMSLFGISYVDAGLYFWNDEGDTGFYDFDNPPSLPRAVKSYLYAIDGYTYKFVEWEEISIVIPDKTAYQLDWNARANITIKMLFERLPTQYKKGTSAPQEGRILDGTIYETLPGETVNLVASATREYTEGTTTWTFVFKHWAVEGRGDVSIKLAGSENQTSFAYVMQQEFDNEAPPTRTAIVAVYGYT